MGKFIDITGQQFNNFIVLEFLNKRDKHNKLLWLCECQCENKTLVEVTAQALKKGKRKSCGCTYATIVPYSPYKKRLQSIYFNMISRCYKPSNPSYKYYKEKGIIVCDEWLDKKDGFFNFYNWAINNGYQENLTIDRENNHGDYEPLNCRWITMREQSNNRDVTIKINIDGNNIPLSELADDVNINYATLISRIKSGWNDDILTLPLKKERLININGEVKNLKEWSEFIGVSTSCFHHRLKLGLKNDDLLKPSGYYTFKENKVATYLQKQGDMITDGTN